MKQKGNITLIAIIFVIIVITAGVIGYLFAKKTSEPKIHYVSQQPIVPMKQNQTIDEASGWQIYQNSTYGYQVEYPDGWFVYDENPADIFIQEQEEEFGSIPGPHANAFEIKVTKTSKTLSEEFEILGKQTGITYVQENLAIDGMNGLKVISNCEGVGCGTPEWLMINNGNLYHFSSNLGYSRTFDKILNSFKFIK